MPKLLINYSKIMLRNEMTSISLFRMQRLPSRLIKTLHCSECHAFKPKPNETCNDDHHYKGYIYLANHSIWQNYNGKQVPKNKPINHKTLFLLILSNHSCSYRNNGISISIIKINSNLGFTLVLLNKIIFCQLT